MASRVPRITRSGRKLNDFHSQKAKTDGYVARSAYKLLEIQQKHHLIPPGGKVLDLGCHPGAWLQVACQSLGPRNKGGLVLGVDIQATTAPPRFTDDRVKILQADARTLGPAFWATHYGFDVVLSDMCHFTHGNVVADAYKSLELARTAYELATMQEVRKIIETEPEFTKEHDENISDNNAPDNAAVAETPHKKNIVGILRPGGSLVMKLLQGPGTQEFAQELKTHFNKVAWHRPKATRSESKEVFLIGMKKK